MVGISGLKGDIMQDIKLVIFDMDGVILDSEPVHLASKKKILKTLGLSATMDLSKYVGVANEELWAEVIEKNQLSMEVRELVELQDKYNFQIILEEKIPLSDGLLEVLDFLERNEIDAGVASSSTRGFVNQVLNHFEINERFKFIVTGDDVSQKKPNPEIYQKALLLGKSNPTEALAIEDSKMGTLAAKRAGIPCIGYKNPTSGNQDLSHSILEIQLLTEVIAYMQNCKKTV